MTEARKRIIVALDVSTEKEALELVFSLREYVGMFKIGLELLNSVGLDVVRKIIGIGSEVFVDAKFLDIPNTVGGAARALTRLGIRMFNVHALGGLEMMNTTVESSMKEASSVGVNPPIVLAVTVLTSLDQDSLTHELRVSDSMDDYVVHLALLAEKAGVGGVICSPHEVKAISKKVSDKFLLVTPGVRPVWAAAKQDQKRVMTPREAINSGASHIVIGRPVTKPPAEIGSSVDAAKLVVAEVETALRESNAN